MSDEKLEPRLRATIDQQKTRAAAAGITAAEVDEQPLTVTISHAEPVRAHTGEDRSELLADLERRTRESQRTLLGRLEQLGAPVAREHTLTNAVTAQLSPAQMRAVAELDEVELIRHERLDDVALMDGSVGVIELREAAEAFGLDGRGIKVAILDSGIDASHPALFGKVVDEVTTTNEPVSVPGDHGTHVAGTVASNDPVFRGVAPQADLVNIKVLTAGGSGQPQWVIDGLEQAVRRGALVANLSLGWSEPFHGWVCNDADCILCQAADNASRLGVTVVVAAGNEGNAVASDPAFAGMTNIRHPGAARRVITVGAVDKSKQLASFSSIGPGTGQLTPGSGIRMTKPDLAAPGVGITSPIAGGGFATFNGTSMASPHVAGLAALVLQKHADATPLMVKKLLEDSSEDLPYAPNEAGYGLVNALAALMRSISVK
jgi:subtilisin family serine protease